MIVRITGEVVEKSEAALVILAGGLGYEVLVNPSVIEVARVGESITLSTYFSIRESSQELFGFTSRDSLGLFKQLITISGVGPKTALHILSLGSVEELTGAISRGDLGYLTKVAGVGKKTAERIVVELKGKVAAVSATTAMAGGNTDGTADLVELLAQMGYSPEEARDAARHAMVLLPEASLEVRLRAALQSLARS
ncbi:MAG: Holliday junction branch migration protein RuvA [Patescibacteria group bacterium]